MLEEDENVISAIYFTDNDWTPVYDDYNINIVKASKSGVAILKDNKGFYILASFIAFKNHMGGGNYSNEYTFQYYGGYRAIHKQCIEILKTKHNLILEK